MQKICWGLGLIFLFISTISRAASPDFSVYMRAGSGGNGRGGRMECVNNVGTPFGNEFRLGNECDTYGEFALALPILKPEGQQGPFFRFFSNFSFSNFNVTDYDNAYSIKVNTPANTATGHYDNWIMREAYTEGGNFDGMHFSVWAGKRYYRWGEVHLDDFYVVSMSGPGGGFGDVHLRNGILSMAVIQNSEALDANGLPTTKNGPAAKTSLHLRIEEVKSAVGDWAFWLAGATTPSTVSQDDGNQYKASSGGYFAVKNNVTLGNSNNEVGVAYGQGNMTDMWVGGDLVKDCASTSDPSCTISKQSRTRFWESYVDDGPQWSTQFALIYDDVNHAIDTGSHVRWTSLGIRPERWFTDHISLAFQAGISNVVDESDGLGSRNMMRFTVAPQLSLGKGYYSRPVIRAFYSHSQWGKNNMKSVAGTSAANDTSLDNVGVQTEVWF